MFPVICYAGLNLFGRCFHIILCKSEPNAAQLYSSRRLTWPIRGTGYTKWRTTTRAFRRSMQYVRYNFWISMHRLSTIKVEAATTKWTARQSPRCRRRKWMTVRGCNNFTVCGVRSSHWLYFSGLRRDSIILTRLVVYISVWLLITIII